MRPKKQTALYPVYPGVVTMLLKYGYKVYELPKDEANSLAADSFIPVGCSKHYFVFNKSLIKQGLSFEEPLHVVDAKAKQSLTDIILQSINNAYMTGYQEKPDLINGIVDVTLDTQKLRIIYLPSTAMLSIIATDGGIIT
jgi:hypothetical protein